MLAFIQAKPDCIYIYYAFSSRKPRLHPVGFLHLMGPEFRKWVVSVTFAGLVELEVAPPGRIVFTLWLAVRARGQSCWHFDTVTGVAEEIYCNIAGNARDWASVVGVTFVFTLWIEVMFVCVTNVSMNMDGAKIGQQIKHPLNRC
jgi:hypothetical protein